MDFSFIERVVLEYLAKHPEVVQQVIESLLDRLVEHLKAPAPAK